MPIIKIPYRSERRLANLLPSKDIICRPLKRRKTVEKIILSKTRIASTEKIMMATFWLNQSSVRTTSRRAEIRRKRPKLIEKR